MSPAWLEELRQDLRYALRGLHRAPAFALVAVLSLALGIGSSTAVFSVVDVLALRRVPVREAAGLVNFREHLPPNRVVDVFTYEELERFRRLPGVFSAVAGVTVVDRSNVATDGAHEGDPARVRVALVTGNYFDMLGVTALRGRTLAPSDDRVPDGEPVAVISHAYWKRRFARDSTVVGRTLSLHGTKYTIAGVMRPTFAGDWVGRPVDIWIPMMMESEVMVDRPRLVTDPSLQGYFVRVVARLAPGVALARAQAVASVEQQTLLRDMYWSGDPRTLRDLTERQLVLEPAARGYSPERESMTEPLAVLAMLVGLVLLIACANVAGLVATRTTARRRELALRLAIGAGRARLMRQLFAETALLTVVACALGVVFAGWAAKALVSGVSAGGQMRATVEGSSWLTFEPRLDARVVAFASALCVVTTLLVGLWPAARGTGAAPATALAGRGPSMMGRDRSRFGRAVVVAQVALSLLVLVDTGLLVRSLGLLRSKDLGFDRRRVLLVWAQPGLTGRRGAALWDYWHEVVQRASMISGVVAAGAANGGVLDGYEWTGRPVAPMRVAGKPPMPAGIPGGRQFVTPGFFGAAGLTLVAGRDFTELDTNTALRAVIINETVARYYFGRENPIGRIVGFPGDRYAATQVIGVVHDATSGTPRERQQLGLTYFLYRHPEASGPRIGGMVLALRTEGAASALSATVGRALHDFAPDLTVLRIDTVEQQLDDVLAKDRLLASLGGFFAFVGTLLSCLGLYGLLQYTAARRTTEIGVRMALGASVRQVLGMVLKEGVVLVAVGLAIGVPLTLAARQLIGARLVGVSATDPVTIVLSALVLASVALIAGLLPAWRAATVDPLVALRHD
jgi:predicted permease